MAWQEICGHVFPKKYISHLQQSGLLGHAFLFSGPPGSGKTAFACEMARLVNCSTPGPGGACGSCASCRLIQAGTHPDVRSIAPREGYLRIDDIRSFIHWMSLQRSFSPYRVGVLSEVELMTEEAANCLLKNLEEPPDFSLLILVTAHPGNLLSTLRSRCRHLGFSSPAPEEIQDFLTDTWKVPSPMAGVISREASGQVGEAIRLWTSVESMKQVIDEIRTTIFGLEKETLSGENEFRSTQSQLWAEIDRILTQGNPFGQDKGVLQQAFQQLKDHCDRVSGEADSEKRTKKTRKDSWSRLAGLIEQSTPTHYQAIAFWKKLTGPTHLLSLGEWLRGERDKGQTVQDWIQSQLNPLLTCLENYLRDVMLYQLLGPSARAVLFFPDMEAELNRDAGMYRRSTLARLVRQIESFSQKMSSNPQMDIQAINFLLEARTILDSS